jgi:signal transduction histidine kinase
VGKSVDVVVADDGPGIPTFDRERVSDRFTRLDEARSRRSGGVGLRLPIPKEIVTAHGGSIAVADAPKGAPTRENGRPGPPRTASARLGT